MSVNTFALKSERTKKFKSGHNQKTTLPINKWQDIPKKQTRRQEARIELLPKEHNCCDLATD